MPRGESYEERAHREHHESMEMGIQMFADIMEAQFRLKGRASPNWESVDRMRRALEWYEQRAAVADGCAKVRYDYKMRWLRTWDAYHSVLCPRCKQAVDEFVFGPETGEERRCAPWLRRKEGRDAR